MATKWIVSTNHFGLLTLTEQLNNYSLIKPDKDLKSIKWAILFAHMAGKIKANDAGTKI